MSRSRSVVAGVMRSTMPFGKGDVVADPVGELRIEQLGEPDDGVRR